MAFAADYPLLEITATILVACVVAFWLWLVIVMLTDVFRRRDASGWAKAGWTVFLLALPLVGVLIYLVAHGRGLAERREREAELRWTRFDAHVRAVAASEGPVADIAHAKRLLDIGAIDETEFAKLKSQVL